MRKYSVLVLVILFFITSTSSYAQVVLEPFRDGPLSQSLVIIDPGHGNLDTGASVSSKGRVFNESAYSYSFARLLCDLIREQGGRVVLTVYDPSMGNLARENLGFPQNPSVPNKARYTWNKKIVTTTSPAKYGILPRLEAARWAWNKYHLSKQVCLICLHLDDIPHTQDGGSYVLVDGKSSRFSHQIADCLRQKGVLNPLFPSGVSKERLVILNPKYNPIPNSILVEVANLGSPLDLKRLQKNPAIFMQSIVKGLIGQTKNKPIILVKWIPESDPPIRMDSLFGVLWLLIASVIFFPLIWEKLARNNKN